MLPVGKTKKASSKDLVIGQNYTIQIMTFYLKRTRSIQENPLEQSLQKETGRFDDYEKRPGTWEYLVVFWSRADDIIHRVIFK